MTTPVSIGTANSTSTVSSLVITTTGAVAAGDTVWVALVTGATAPSAVSVADSGSNTWSADVALNSNNVAWFRTKATNAISSGGSITLTLTGGTSAVCAIAVRQSGQTLDTDGTVQDSGLTASNQAQPKTIAETGGDVVLVVNAMFGSESGAPTVDSPYTLVDSSYNSSRGIVVAYNAPASSLNETFTAHWPVGHTGQILAFNYTAGAGGGGGTTTNVNTSDTHTYDDSFTDLQLSDDIADITYSDTSALAVTTVSTETLAWSDSSSVATTVPSASDILAWDDVSSITVLDAPNITSADLHQWTDTSSLNASLLITGTDTVTYTDLSFVIEAATAGVGVGTVVIASSAGTVTITPRTP